MQRMTLLVDDETLTAFEKKRGLIPKSAILRKLVEGWVSGTSTIGGEPNVGQK
jgi:hypothetical protein